jgi:hypothetical protein
MPRAILGALGGPNDPLAIPGRAVRVQQRVDVAGRLAPQARRLPAALPGREIYLHADNKLKQQAIDRTAPTGTPPGRYKPPDQLLAFLERL